MTEVLTRILILAAILGRRTFIAGQGMAKFFDLLAHVGNVNLSSQQVVTK
jgi:hypothetical protein